MTIIEERAPAKINLTLDVLGRRSDGYHELRSLVAFAVDAFDVVTLDTSRPPGCEVAGPFGQSIAGQNLIELTLAKLAAADANFRLGHVTLTKNLPVAAGIGGGSADAAAVLRAIARANPDRAAALDWTAIALAIGSDVPVCLQNSLSWMTGIGDGVTPIETSLSNLYAVIANPRVPVPADKTAQVYRALRAPALASTIDSRLPQPTFDSVASGGNALQPAAIEIVPEIGDVLAELAKLSGANVTRMSGGGPTCFALFDTTGAAHAAAVELRVRRPAWWIAASALA